MQMNLLSTLNHNLEEFDIWSHYQICKDHQKMGINVPSPNLLDISV